MVKDTYENNLWFYYLTLYVTFKCFIQKDFYYNFLYMYTILRINR